MLSLCPWSLFSVFLDPPRHQPIDHDWNKAQARPERLKYNNKRHSWNRTVVDYIGACFVLGHTVMPDEISRSSAIIIDTLKKHSNTKSWDEEKTILFWSSAWFTTSESWKKIASSLWCSRHCWTTTSVFHKRSTVPSSFHSSRIDRVDRLVTFEQHEVVLEL